MAFFRNIATLITGTSIAQAIPVAISPILTRIYSPKEFGLLALYISIVSIFSVVATCRYELAIIQPESNNDAKTLFFLSILLTFLVSVFALIIVLFYNIFGWNIFENPDIGTWLYLAPVSIFLMGIYNTCTYWLLRDNNFTKMSNAKMVQGLSISSLQIIIGFVRNTGLIFGQLLGQLISVLYILKSVTKNCKKNNIPKYKQVINIAKAYKNMPMYSTPGAFADTLSLQMPIFMISHFFGTFITGIFSFTFRILNMPSSLISSAISQVLYKKINDAIKYKNYNIIMSLVVKVFVGLLLLILPFAFIIWFFGEDIFSFIFGDEWKHAGELAGILVFAVVIRFSVSPLSSVLLIEQNIKLGVSWQITYLITISITLFFFRNYEIQNFLWIFVIHELLLYLLYFVVILIGVKRLQEIQ